ncbi:MAG: hypothetical protein RLZZ418_275 [Pseudomonadota bacterium]|jgi:hypothetical protein
MTYLDPRYKSSLIETGLQPSGMMAPPTIYNVDFSISGSKVIIPDFIYGNALYRIKANATTLGNTSTGVVSFELKNNVLKQLFGNVCIIYFYIELLTGTFDPYFPKFQLIISTDADSESISFFPTKQSDINICTYALLIDNSFDPNSYNSSRPYNRIYPINNLNKASQFRK